MTVGPPRGRGQEHAALTTAREKERDSEREAHTCVEK